MIKDEFFTKAWENQFRKKAEGLEGLRIFKSKAKFHPYTAILKMSKDDQHLYLPVSLREDSEGWNDMVEGACKTFTASYEEAKEDTLKTTPFLKIQARGRYCYEHGVKIPVYPETARRMAARSLEYGSTLENHLQWLESTDIKALFEECDKEREEA